MHWILTDTNLIRVIISVFISVWWSSPLYWLHSHYVPVYLRRAWTKMATIFTPLKLQMPSNKKVSSLKLHKGLLFFHTSQPTSAHTHGFICYSHIIEKWRNFQGRNFVLQHPSDFRSYWQSCQDCLNFFYRQ